MTTEPSTRGLTRIQGFLYELPRDLVGVFLAVVIANVIFTAPTGDPFPLRVIAGFGFVLIVPGYALVSAVFPTRPRGEIADPSLVEAYSPGTAERIALSFGMSLALIPVLSLVQGLLGIPFTVATTVGSVSVLTIMFTVLGIVRRLASPPSKRYDPPSVVSRLQPFTVWVGGPRTTDTVLNVALTIAVLVALGSIGYGLSSPSQSTSYTTASLVTQTADGEYTASGYPDTFTVDESQQLTLRLDNRYDTAAEYTVFIELQRVKQTESGELAVLEQAPAGQLQTTVGPDETQYRQHEVNPAFAGDELRLVYYIYRNGAPDDPNRETAETTLHLWITAELGGDGNGS